MTITWNCAPQFFMHISSAGSARSWRPGLDFFRILSLSAFTVSLPWRWKSEFTRSHMSTFTPQSGPGRWFDVA